MLLHALISRFFCLVPEKKTVVSVVFSAKLLFFAKVTKVGLAQSIQSGNEPRHRHGTAPAPRHGTAPVILDSPWPRVDQNDQMANGPISIRSIRSIS